MLVHSAISRVRKREREESQHKFKPDTITVKEGVVLLPDLLTGSLFSVPLK